MDDNVSNINNITRFRPYDGKNDFRGKGKRKKKKNSDDKDLQDDNGMTNSDKKDVERDDYKDGTENDAKNDAEDDDMGLNLDVDI
ncbi:MAG: hypothetical protein ACUZ8O_05085 [Candidatus Anammoxibacter sp.]